MRASQLHGEQRFAHVREARTAISAVFVGDAFYPKRTRTHGGVLTSGSSRSPCRWRRQIILNRIRAAKPGSVPIGLVGCYFLILPSGASRLIQSDCRV